MNDSKARAIGIALIYDLAIQSNNGGTSNFIMQDNFQDNIWNIRIPKK